MISKAFVFAFALFLAATPYSTAHAQTITQIIDVTGDGAGNTLSGSRGIAVDGAGNVYVTGADSDNAFKITPAGLITKILVATGALCRACRRARPGRSALD